MLAKRLEEWVERAERDSTPEEFITQFHNYSLPSWDHYTHVRIAYVILTMYGRSKGPEYFIQSLELFQGIYG